MNWYIYYNEVTSTLELPSGFNEKLVDLPKDTTKIIFDKNSFFNRSLDILPHILTHLTFGYTFNRSVGHQGCADNKCPRNLPANLTHLTFGYCFNQTVDKLPPNLTHLTFGFCFNRNANNLPPNIIQLTFGDCFNQSVNNLPPNLKYLTLGYYFDQSVADLPSTLTNLFLGACASNNVLLSIDKLPKSITDLTLYSTSPIINNIPEQVKNIEILFDGINKDSNKIIDNIPHGIKQIKIDNANVLKFIKKIPFGCKILDKNNNQIFLQ